MIYNFRKVYFLNRFSLCDLVPDVDLREIWLDICVDPNSEIYSCKCKCGQSNIVYHSLAYCDVGWEGWHERELLDRFYTSVQAEYLRKNSSMWGLRGAQSKKILRVMKVNWEKLVSDLASVWTKRIQTLRKGIG